MTSPTCIQTYSRKMLDLARPDPADVDFRDVALGLARCSRFVGQTLRRYSVAEHSIRVAQVAREEARLEKLLHDAREGYLGDWSTPLKQAIREGLGNSQAGLDALLVICDIEDGVQRAIVDKLLAIVNAVRELRGDGPLATLFRADDAATFAAVKHADLVLLSTEARDLLPGGPVDDWTRDLPPALDTQIGAGAWDGLDDLAWAERWLAHVEDAAGLEPGALAPLHLYSARNWNNRPYLGVFVRARDWRVR